MSKLSKCPFCEGETNPEVDHEVTGYYVLCTWCGARTCGHQTREQAVEYWNTRELESKLQSAITGKDAEILRLRELLREVKEDAEFWLEYYLNDVDIDLVPARLKAHDILTEKLKQEGVG